MSNHNFIATDYTPGTYMIIHNYVAGLFARKDVLKDFCSKSGIEYKPKPGHKYVVPSEYLLEHTEIKYLSGLRDKKILIFYEDYLKQQTGILREQKTIRGEAEVQDQIIEAASKDFAKKETSLKDAKDPQARITLQNLTELARTKVNNAKLAKTELETKLAECDTMIAANFKNWEKQVDIINKAFDIRRSRFEKNASKRLMRILNYTGTYSKLDDYAESVSKIVKGDFDENLE